MSRPLASPEPYLVVVLALNGRWIVACGACHDVVDQHDQEPAARALAAEHQPEQREDDEEAEEERADAVGGDDADDVGDLLTDVADEGHQAVEGD